MEGPGHPHSRHGCRGVAHDGAVTSRAARAGIIHQAVCLGGGPVAVPRPIILHSPGDPSRCSPASDSYANISLWGSVGGERVWQTFLLDMTAYS
jgi:hypothetical protein